MRKVALLLVMFACLLTSGYGALVPPDFVTAVVALGSQQLRIVPGQPCSLQWVTEGTGFLYGYMLRDVKTDDPKKHAYVVFLVTNRHVIEEHVASQVALKAQQQTQLPPGCPRSEVDETNIGVRVNPVKSSVEGKQFTIPIKEWFYHPNTGVDIAVVPVNAPFMNKQGVLGSYFHNDAEVATKEKLKTLGVSAGDGAFVLGFPMNLAGGQRNYVIVRQGCIARIEEMLDGPSQSYLLDAFIFPGNSGGPVILRPEIVSIEGTPAQHVAYLIGIVKAYQPYIDYAVSAQTKRARITFEENSGLAEVLPVDFIEETISEYAKSHPLN